MDPGQDDDDAPMIAFSTITIRRTHNWNASSKQLQQNFAVIKKKGWAGAEVKDVKELEEQLDGVIMNSSDIVGDVSSWFDLCYPEPPGDGTTARKNQKIFLTEIAKRNRTMKKMARIGVATKIIFTFVLGYVDILTDLLVAKSYYDIGNFGTAYSTATFSVTSITAQAIFTFKQYKKKGWRERLGRSLLAQLGLAPLMEGARVWTGKEDSDLLLSAPAMYACMKAIEICFESIPEAIIQEHYLSLEVGMMGYAICLALASVGLTLFLMNCDENFDRSLFWKPKSGKQHARSCLTDMAGENEEKFIKRLVEIYSWKDGEDGDVVNKALSTLFGRSGEDLEVGVDGQVTFIKTKRSKKSLGKVGPE
ncbi:hypothetical protein TrLO_g15912 [Triparma laevis f. longispina]|uniref:Uncharacterized protein n=1 Tax=Triparma laevis f. longispina TaxID=1714387 RepID=A0A9W7DZC3_9STRA|nr:hypothetical protein TrLO_g15912 [Triparma laevis f. longispina]